MLNAAVRNILKQCRFDTCTPVCPSGEESGGDRSWTRSDFRHIPFNAFLFSYPHRMNRLSTLPTPKNDGTENTTS